MSVLFGLYQPEEGEIRKNGEIVEINDPNDATALGIGMVHQHFKLVDVFTVLDNIILGAETTDKMGFLKKKEAREKVMELSERYGLKVDVDAKVEDITVGMQQRVEILKMLYRENEILIFDDSFSALDFKTDREVRDALAKEAKGSTKLIVAQRIGTIMNADRIIVLDDGKVVGQGTHQELLDTCDVYRQIAESQLSQSELTA